MSKSEGNAAAGAPTETQPPGSAGTSPDAPAPKTRRNRLRVLVLLGIAGALVWYLFLRTPPMPTGVLAVSGRLGFLVSGELVAQGTPSGIKAEQGGRVLEVITDRPQQAANLLKDALARWRVSLFGDRLHVILESSLEEGVRFLRERLEPAGVHLLEASEQGYSLEDVFIAVVEKARKQGAIVEE